MGTPCVHAGEEVRDGSFHDIGSASGADIGRARLSSRSVKLRYAFKVPTLRNTSTRGFWMHDGSFLDLHDVIDLYDRGGIDRPIRSSEIHPLGLDEREKSAIM